MKSKRQKRNERKIRELKIAENHPERIIIRSTKADLLKAKSNAKPNVGPEVPICKYCKKEFKRSKYFKVYCSVECREKAEEIREIEYQQKLQAEYDALPEEKVCIKCRQSKHKSEYAYNGKATICNECFVKQFNKTHKITYEKYLELKSKNLSSCFRCGKEFPSEEYSRSIYTRSKYKSNSRFSKIKHNFCPECQSYYRLKRMLKNLEELDLMESEYAQHD